jgi:peptide/nickel transport system permease protein
VSDLLWFASVVLLLLWVFWSVESSAKKFTLRIALSVCALSLALALVAHTPKNNDGVDYQQLRQAGATLIRAPIPYGPFEVTLGQRLLPASLEHPFGTDRLGRDVLSCSLHGLRISLLVGFGAVGLALLIGSLFGGCAGYFGGWFDRFFGAVVQIISCFPALVLILLIFSFLDPSLFSMILVLALLGWITPARLLRGEVARIRAATWVLVAKTQGVGIFRMLRNHVLPHTSGPLWVHGTLAIAGSILVEATLSFLGLAPDDHVSLGTLLRQGRESLPSGSHLIIFPGLLLLSMVLALHGLADRFRKSDAILEAREVSA